MTISNSQPVGRKQSGASVHRALAACTAILSAVAFAGCAGPLRTAGEPFIEAGHTIRNGFASLGNDKELPFYFDERSREIDSHLGR